MFFLLVLIGCCKTLSSGRRDLLAVGPSRCESFSISCIVSVCPLKPSFPCRARGYVDPPGSSIARHLRDDRIFGRADPGSAWRSKNRCAGADKQDLTIFWCARDVEKIVTKPPLPGDHHAGERPAKGGARPCPESDQGEFSLPGSGHHPWLPRDGRAVIASCADQASGGRGAPGWMRSIEESYQQVVVAPPLSRSTS